MGTRLRSWVARHDVAAFLLITFGVGWVFDGLAAWLLVAAPSTVAVLAVFQTPGAAAPLAAAWGVRWAKGGRADVEAAWRRYLWFRRPWPLYVAAVVVVPACAAAAVLAAGRPGAGLAHLVGDLGWWGLALLPVVLVAQLPSSPLLEEFGWRGWFQPRLQAVMPALPAALLTGALWGVHHLPIVLALGADPWLTVVGALGPSVLAAWLLNKGAGSMVLPMLLHASLNLATLVVAPPGWGFPLLTLAAAAVVVGVSGWRDLARRPRQVEAPAPDAA